VLEVGAGVEVEVLGGGVLVVGGEVVVVGGGQLSDTITAPAGSEIVPSEIPSGTANVVTSPPNSRTVTVHD
jgi:hypothetical protein